MKFQIYSKENCPYCTRAVFILQTRNLQFEELKLGNDFSREEILAKFPSAKTFPQIQLVTEDGEQYIGGYNELVNYLEGNNGTSQS